jgi:hypothetical protein
MGLTGKLTLKIKSLVGLSFLRYFNFSIQRVYQFSCFLFIFTDFKDFTKNTGKLGLSFGEKFAFWCYGKARGLSTNSFTHILLLIIMCLYCALGGIAFFVFENEERGNIVRKLEKEDREKIINVTEVTF